MFAELILCASVLMADPEAEQSVESTPESRVELAAYPYDEYDLERLAELRDKVIDGVNLLAIEANIVTYTNEYRAQYGLPPLEVDPDLMETAREHARWMCMNYSMVHTSLPVAENIAMGQPHSSDAVNAWMNSRGHRANILNSGHTRIGVGAFRTENGTIFWCQQFK